MLNETIDGMNIDENGIYVDCTFGGGGHSSLIFSKLKNGKVYGFDRDADAIENAKAKYSKEIAENKLILINENFVMSDIREGELSISHYWFELYRKIYAKEKATFLLL